ncbi:MAG: c-type cytochrome [Rhodospirillales bacterium]
MKTKLRLMACSGCLALAFGIAVVSGHSWAHGGATGVVKERMTLMEGIGDAVKALAAMMKGEADYDAEKVKSLASGIADHAGKRMVDLFPKGTSGHPSEAKPAIWDKWDTFQGLADRLETYAGALAQTADNPRGTPGGGEMMGQNQGMMGQGMMGQGQGMMGQGQGMMGQGQGMMGQGMMGGGMMGQGMMEEGPTAEQLAAMPPDAAFMHLLQTCSSCHEQFRQKKQ